MKKPHRFVSATVILFWFAVIVQVCGADWPQWRGPDRNGISAEKGLMKSWPDGGPELLWQVRDLGSGYGTVAVAGKRLYIQTNEGLENEYVRALDAAGGKTIWSVRIGNVGNPDQRPNFPAARSTPTVDGDRLFALGSDGDLTALDLKTGKVFWQKSLRTDFGGTPGNWAYAESPLVDGDKVVATPGGPESTVVALDKNTGKLIWACDIPGNEKAAYASAIVIQAGKVRQIVVFVESFLAGIDSETGKLLWTYNETKGIANIPTPVARQSYVYSSASRKGGALIRIVPGEDSVRTEQIYFDAKLPNAIGGTVLAGDCLYGTAANGSDFFCIDFMTGQEKWKAASDAAPGALCYADGMLYVHGENGNVALIEASCEAYREISIFAPPDQPEKKDRMEKAWAYPVIADGRLYIRDQNMLWCYKIK
ncbi:PQQ-binding-like beta-propeller repeat protein [bacterium]|nr:PQQ-binding-like beta-propeller repeat protein [bacterium]